MTIKGQNKLKRRKLDCMEIVEDKKPEDSDIETIIEKMNMFII